MAISCSMCRSTPPPFPVPPSSLHGPSYAQIASIPIGYNNPALLKAARSDDMINGLINRPALGNFPPEDWAEVLKSGILKVAPKGLNQVFTAMAGSDANETAYKAA